MAVFEALQGRAYAGNPRAVYRAFLAEKRFVDHTFVWAFRAPVVSALAARGYDVRGLKNGDASRTGPPVDLDLDFGAEALDELRRATIVVSGGDSYRLCYAQAGYWVADSLLPDYLVPRKCQMLVQTWNGSPLRRFGCDTARSADSDRLHSVFEFEGRRLTRLLAPSQYAAEKYVTAFCLGRKKRQSAIIREASPSSDALCTATPGYIASVRERLGVAPGKKVALWAPSAPPAKPAGAADGSSSPRVDIDALKAALGNDIVLLMRGDADASAVQRSRGFAIDARSVSDINDLYLVSDVLVTDYSSALFDYALLRRPIILHLSEKERDPRHDHGLYADPRMLPARMAFSQDELVQALQSAITDGADEVGSAIATFNDRFNPLADGHAAERVLDHIAFRSPGVVPPPTRSERATKWVRGFVKKTKKATKRAMFSAGKRWTIARTVSQTVLNTTRRANYRKHLKQTSLNPKMIAFESFVGWKYSCNPRALYEAVLNDPAFDDFTLVWAFKDPDAYQGSPEFERASLVTYGSQAYYACHAEAKYWISNSVVFPHMSLRAGQVYVQTWHGTPLKRLGCDIETKPASGVKLDPEEKRQWYETEGRRFTFLLAQSPFAAKALESAFGLAASGHSDAILQTGYPRNDYLATHTLADVERIRRELDLPDDKTIVLYAPTWRDDQHEVGVGYTLDVGVDFDALREELGDTHVILFRAHYLIASAFHFESYEGFVRDVSEIDDINELYVVSDLLITDYSSVFFDYANLRRPILFYMYDLARYADQIRGFYLDLADLPGPIIEHQDDLVAGIRAAASPSPEATQVLEGFADRFTALDDGHASERVLTRMLQSPGHTAAR